MNTGTSMRWPYVLFFSSSCFLYAAGRLLELLLGALGWNTLTSKKASWRVFQKSFARTSSRTPSSVLVEASLKDSPDSGCKCGSMATLGQTSVSREAVKPSVVYSNVMSVQSGPTLCTQGVLCILEL